MVGQCDDEEQLHYADHRSLWSELAFMGVSIISQKDVVSKGWG